MKKFLGSLFMLLVAGGAASPYVCGYYAKKNYHHALETLSKAENYKIEIISYDLGWLRSHASLKITLPKHLHNQVCSDSKDPLILKFEETIQHGPILLGQGESKMKFAFAKVDGKFTGLDDQLMKSCANLVDFKWPIPPSDLYSSETVIDFNGDFNSKLKGKPFNYTKNGVTVKWQGLSGELNLNNNMRVLNYKILFPSIEITEQSALVKVKEVSLKGNHQKMGNRDLWPGDFKLNISSIDVQEGEMAVALKGMTFATVARLVNNFVSISSNHIIESLAFDNIKLGPINMVFSFNHLEPTFLEMVKNIHQNTKETPDSYLTALKSYQSKDKQDALFIINQQLKLTPEAKIDQIMIENAKGQILINALASLGGPDAKLDKLENYFTLMSMFKTSGEFNIDESIFDYMLEKQSQETAEGLPKEFWAQQQTTQEKWVSDNVAKLKDEAIKTGAFVHEGKKMIMRFKYENNSFNINGKSVNEIMAKHAELNKPKVEPVPVPEAPAETTPGLSNSMTMEPQLQPLVNNPNDPAKPSEPMPISDVKEAPKMGAVPGTATPAEAPQIDMPKIEEIPAVPAPAKQ